MEQANVPAVCDLQMAGTFSFAIRRSVVLLFHFLLDKNKRSIYNDPRLEQEFHWRDLK